MEYNSKSGSYGIPIRKWIDLKAFVAENFIQENTNIVRKQIDASHLLSALGKFHHFTQVWIAGRPSLYPLWRLFYTAEFRGPDLVLHPKTQKLSVDVDAKEALGFWWSALRMLRSPQRRMLKCSGYIQQLLGIFKFKNDPRREEYLWLEVPSGAWKRPDKLPPSRHPKQTTSAMKGWLEALQEALEVMDLPSDTEAVVVRTNIYKLAEAIRNDLYVKDISAMTTANEIHALLARLPKTRKDSGCPLELRVVLVEGGTPHPRD